MESVPILLRRRMQEVGLYCEVGRPVRVPRNKLLKAGGIENAVQLALLRPECDYVFIVFDAHEVEEVCRMAPLLLQRATGASVGKRVSVVLAVKEFEAWLLAALLSLRGYNGIRGEAAPPADPEAIPGAKERLEGCFEDPRRAYAETIDQPRFASRFSFNEAAHVRSFRKLLKEMDAAIRRASS